MTVSFVFEMRIFQIFMAGVAAAALLMCVSGCGRSERTMDAPAIKKITRENVHGVFAADDDHIWITGNYGTIYCSRDGGSSWTEQESGVEEGILVDGQFLDSRTGWVVGLYGTVLHTSDGGNTWKRQKTGTERHLFDLSFTDLRCGWAVGEWGTVMHTTDGGQSWKPQRREIDRTFNNVVFVDNQTGWIVGERGIILHTSDGGCSWQRQVPELFERDSFEEMLKNPPPSLYGAAFTDSRHGWACGIGGTVIRTTDGGERWEPQPASTDMTLYTVFIRWGRGWIVGDKGTYLISADGGASWELRDGAIASRKPLGGIFFSSPDKGWAVGAAGTVVHTTDGGASWEFRSGISYEMEFFQMPEALEFKGRVFE